MSVVAYAARPSTTCAMRDWIGPQIAGPKTAVSRVAQVSARVLVEVAFAMAVLQQAA